MKKTSLLIDENRIDLIKDSFQHYKFIRMDGSPYMMVPTNIVFDNKIVNFVNSKEQKSYIEENIIKKGCTTILCYVEVKREKDWLLGLKKLKGQLINCAIDYVIGVKIPLNSLTPSFVRMCKREKIPVIFVEVTNEKQLYNIPWGWIKESLFPFNPTLVPIFSQPTEQERDLAQNIWSKVMKDVKIPSTPYELKEGYPISFEDITKFGIYPFKGNIHQGGEVTYNLYYFDPAIINIEENDLFLYYYDRILVTIHKGKCIRALDTIFYRPGYGEQFEVKVPSFLSI